MKRILTVLLALLATPLLAQEIDSLIQANPKVNQDIVEASDSTTANNPIENVADNTSTLDTHSADTVYITKVVKDTVFIENPSSSDRYDRRRRYRGEIKTVSGRLGHSGGFGAVSFRGSKFRGETIVMTGLRGGWIINRSLAIGLEGHGVIPTAKFEGLSQSDAVLIGGYGGLFLEPIVLSNQVVHVTFPVSAGSGWLGYHEDFDEGNFDNPDLIEGDVFWYIEPGANVEVNLARNFRLAIGLSKRFTQDLQLVQTDSKAFNKLNYYLTLKIGGF